MQQLVERHRPRTLDAFHGVARPKAILSAFAANPYSSAWLLAGPSGLGKTTMALALAESLGGQLHHIPSRQCNLETVEETVHHCHYIPWSGRWHVVIVDEADQMSKAAQHAFLSVLDSAAPPPDTIFIFTANSTAALEERFVSRCRLVEYTSDSVDIVALLKRIWESEGKGKQAPDFAALAKRASGNVRRAIMDLELELIAAPADTPKKGRWLDIGGGRMTFVAA